ncbi:lytic polysaccharide monooxygenase auxiliary activity family 9 protein [Pseudomonas sp. GW456-R21]|nr:lytic polysaccharide monooxygenase auxiliary activity family 9 protein [Pseudomonas sp. GW456-R21]POA27896.1 chitin-binding protein [Pseudomonas sp. GW456-R21]POA62900.1 chitin-binding protein [Pseudomonas sp. GW460-R15]
MASQNQNTSNNTLGNLSPNQIDDLIKSLLGERSQRTGIGPMHGRVSAPKSRAQFLLEEGKLDPGQSNGCEGGKLFPETAGGLPDPAAPEDVRNIAPPVDGMIASGGHSDARALLNAPGPQWQKHDVTSGQNLAILWELSQGHLTRRWKYLITKADWNSNEPLARKHFEETPVATYLNTYQPYWGPEAEKELMPGPLQSHQVTLPSRKGYHVLLAIWDVANTDKAFYQVIDLNFTS